MILIYTYFAFSTCDLNSTSDSYSTIYSRKVYFDMGLEMCFGKRHKQFNMITLYIVSRVFKFQFLCHVVFWTRGRKILLVLACLSPKIVPYLKLVLLSSKLLHINALIWVIKLAMQFKSKGLMFHKINDTL